MAAAEILAPAETERIAPPEVPEDWDPRETKQSLRGTKSFNYQPFDQVISAVQKSVRRGWAYDAVYWALEAFWAGIGATRTNIWNRLLVMSVEDVGPAEPSLLPLIFYHFGANRDDPQTVARCAYLLARSRKTRINDWLAIFRLFPQLDAVQCDREAFRKGLVRLAQETGTAEQLRDQLVAALRAAQPIKCERFIRLLRYHPGRLAGNRAEFGILQAFREVTGGGAYFDVCESLATSPNWKWKSSGPEGKTLLVYSQMVCLWCSGKWAAAEATISKTESGEVDEAAYEERTASVDPLVGPLVDAHETGKMELLGIPDIALDKHTGRGFAKKRGFEYFMEVGSVIENEAPEWLNQSAWFRARVVGCE